MEPFSIYNIVGIGVALAMLIVGSIIDIWKREIHDYYWIGFGIIGVLLIIINPDIFRHLLNVGIALIIAPFIIFVWRIGLFGGADAFALITLAVIAPLATFSQNPVTPFTSIANAIILFIIPFILNVFRNLISMAKHENIFEGFKENRMKKICAMFLGYRAKNPKFCFSMEKIQNGVKKLSITIHHAENEEYCTKPDTWITPGMPYLLLITGGFIIQLVWGDVLLSLFVK
jgi:preflagellin peptidase FlaK